MILIPGQMAVLRYFHIVHSDLSGDALDSGGHFKERQGDVRLHDDVANAVAQKDLHSDTGIGDLGVCEVYQRTGDAVAQLVGMRGVDFFKHSDSPSIAEAPRFSPEAPAHFFMIQAYHVSQGTVYPILDITLQILCDFLFL